MKTQLWKLQVQFNIYWYDTLPMTAHLRWKGHRRFVQGRKQKELWNV